MDFIVLGLPRSGTTWLANWLTTDKSLCLHDPWAQGKPETWPRDCRKFGISCTGSYLLPAWLAQQDCPVAIIERDPTACDASLWEIGFPDTGDMRSYLDRVNGRRWKFEDVWEEEGAAELWSFLLPGIAFDAIRYRQLRLMQVQPYMPRWSADADVLREIGGTPARRI